MIKPWSQWQAGSRAAWGAAGIWCGVAVLHVGLLYRQMSRSPQPIPLADMSLGFAADYLFLLIGTVILGYAFAGNAQRMLRPLRLLSIGLVFVAVITLLMQCSATLAGVWLEHKPLSAFPAMLAARSKFSWWVEICMVLCGFAGQAAHAAWRRAKQEQAQWHQEEAAHMELRLRLLQGQLKPHFLFNALNGISALVRTAEREAASAALRRLRDLLHYAVYASEHDWLSVAQEMAFLRDYMALQELRYGARLLVDWEVADAPWADYACPPLLFQPLPENSITHAVEVRRKACRIGIRLAWEDGMIVFEVSNPLFNQRRATEGHGVGLESIRARLAMLFGPAAELSTGPDETAGVFTARLRFPARPAPMIKSTP